VPYALYLVARGATLLKADELHHHALAAAERDVLLDVLVEREGARPGVAADVDHALRVRLALEDHLELLGLLAGDVRGFGGVGMGGIGGV
jgi:hypothetical protein